MYISEKWVFKCANYYATIETALTNKMKSVILGDQYMHLKYVGHGPFSHLFEHVIEEIYEPTEDKVSD